MSAEPRISIAMGTYNGARYIREQLDSLAAQTLLPCELVVTDDGSADATLEIVRDFAQEAPFPVRIHRNEKRLGYSDNFLFAASLCEGELIAFCDQDDVWLQRKLAICVDEFKNEEVMLCFCDAYVTDKRLGKKGYKIHKIKKRKIYKSLNFPPFKAVYGFTIIFRSILLTKLNITSRCYEYLSDRENPKFISHDNWLVFLAGCFGQIAMVPEPLALYRQHDNNSGGAPIPKNVIRKIIYSASQGEAGYQFLALIAQQRALLLKEGVERIQNELYRRSQRAAFYYEWLSHSLTRRATICSDYSDFYHRITALSTNIRYNTYFTRSFYPLGLRAALKDVLCTIIPRRFLAWGRNL